MVHDLITLHLQTITELRRFRHCIELVSWSLESSQPLYRIRMGCMTQTNYVSRVQRHTSIRFTTPARWLHTVAEEDQGGPIQIRLTPSLQASVDDLAYHLGVMYLSWATCTSTGIRCRGEAAEAAFAPSLVVERIQNCQWHAGFPAERYFNSAGEALAQHTPSVIISLSVQFQKSAHQLP